MKLLKSKDTVARVVHDSVLFIMAAVYLAVGLYVLSGGEFPIWYL